MIFSVVKRESAISRPRFPSRSRSASSLSTRTRCCSHRIYIADLKQIAATLVLDQFGNTADSRRDDRHLASHRFERRETERLGLARQQQQVGNREIVAYSSIEVVCRRTSPSRQLQVLRRALRHRRVPGRLRTSPASRRTGFQSRFRVFFILATISIQSEIRLMGRKVETCRMIRSPLGASYWRTSSFGWRR